MKSIYDLIMTLYLFDNTNVKFYIPVYHLNQFENEIYVWFVFLHDMLILYHLFLQTESKCLSRQSE